MNDTRTPSARDRRHPAGLAALPLAIACALGLAASPVRAAAPTEAELADLKARLVQSLQMIDQLNLRVQALEKQGAAPAAPPSAAAAVDKDAAPGEWGTAMKQRVDEIENALGDLSTKAAAQDGLPLHGFADVGGLSTSQRGAARKGAAIGSLDFYLAMQSGNVRGLSELNFEVSPSDGAVGTDLERLQVGYTVSDALTVWAGRFHSPYGYWNTAYHHGAQIQPSIARPRFLDFEDRGGILPAHDVGLWAIGRVPMGGRTMHYDAWLANAPRIGDDGVLNQNNAGATNGHALFGANVALPVGPATVGLHVLDGRIGGAVDGQSIATLRAFGGYAVYDEDNWEAMTEYFGFDNRNLAGDTHRSNAFYVHVGRSFGEWTPYVRYERASLDPADAYFAAQNSGQSYRRSLLGMRYDIDTRSTLKLEFNHTQLTDRAVESYNESRVQYAIRF
jgi:hypothetical protein